MALVVGGRELLTWIRINLGDLYYVDHGYLCNSAAWGLIGISGVLPAGRALFNPDAQLRSLWLPPIVSLAMMVYPQSAGPPPHERARDHVYIRLPQLAVELKHAANQRHPWHCASQPTATLSPYSRAGERLSYQQVSVAANRPTESLLASGAPGTIDIATSPGEQLVSSMATVLSHNVEDTVRWLRDRSGQPARLTCSSLESP